jgi:hypothetical protein
MALNPLSEALHSVFGPIVKQSAKWPPILAYGLPGIVAVLLITASGLVVPLRLIWLLAIVILAPLAGYVFVDWNARRSTIVDLPRGRSDGAILTPQSNSLVYPTINCSGYASVVRPEDHIWLAVEAMGYTWPKELEVYVTSDNRWNHTIFEDGAANAFSVVLLVANPNGHKIIRDWLEAGKATGEYDLLKSIPGTNRLARIDNLQRMSHDHRAPEG